MSNIWMSNKMDCSYYFGKKAGKRTTNRINCATNKIYIVSPYVSPDLIDMLINKKNEGVKVKLLLKYDQSNYDFYKIVQKLIYQERLVNEEKKDERDNKLKQIAIYKVFFYLLSALLLFLVYQYKGIGFPLLMSIVACLVIKGMLNESERGWRCTPIYFYKYYKNIDFEMWNNENENLHTKLYIVDHDVFTGSFNFTKSGTMHNYESAITFSGEKVMEEFSEYFNSLYTSNENIINLNYLCANYFREQLY